MTTLQVSIGALKLRNPVMTASGTFGFGSEMAQILDLTHLGAVVVKSTSRHPRLGNDTPRIVETAGGLLNAIGLQNGGIDDYLEDKLPKLRQYDVPVIVNLVGESADEFVYLAKRLSDAGAAEGLEINISCPNVAHGCDFSTDPRLTYDLLSKIRKATTLTMVAKLSPNVTDIVEIARAATDAGVDGLSLINTLLGTAIDPRTRRFRLANKTGGLSGPCIKPIALRMVYQVHAALPSIPIIGMGGISSGLDAVEFMLAGATAVAVGTATFVSPLACVHVVEGIRRFLEENQIEDVRDLIGAVRPCHD